MILVFSCFHVVEFNHLLVSHLLVRTHLIGLSVSNIDLLLGDISIHPSLLEIDLLLVQIIETVSIGHPQHAVPLTLTIHTFHVILILLLLHGFLKFVTVLARQSRFLDCCCLLVSSVSLSLTLDDSTPLVDIASGIFWVVPLISFSEDLHLFSFMLKWLLHALSMNFQRVNQVVHLILFL